MAISGGPEGLRPVETVIARLGEHLHPGDVGTRILSARAYPSGADVIPERRRLLVSFAPFPARLIFSEREWRTEIMHDGVHLVNSFTDPNTHLSIIRDKIIAVSSDQGPTSTLVRLDGTKGGSQSGANDNILVRQLLKEELVSEIGLARRELEVLQLITSGLSTEETANRLSISIHTVTTHRKNVMRKLGVDSITEAVVEAIRRDLVDI